MKEYQIYGYNEITNKEFMKGTFYAENNFFATAKFVAEMGIYEFEEGDLIYLIDGEGGEIINKIKF